MFRKYMFMVIGLTLLSVISICALAARPTHSVSSSGYNITLGNTTGSKLPAGYI